MQKRRGFTLVELVIVIAVIAVLAGILIGTFAAVIKRANDSAQIQKTKSEEIAQKAEDILKKIDDSNWYGWEDFEVSIVEKLTKEYEKHASAGSSLTSDDIEKIVKKALVEYGTEVGLGKTELTADQVKAIVENALGNVKYEGVTEAQVRAIVNAATNSLQGTQLTAAQVRAIVNAANANNLTQADVVKAIADAGLATTDELSQVEQKIKEAIGEATKNALTVDDIAEVIKTYVPVTDKVDSIPDFLYDVENLVAGSTIVIDDSLAGEDFEIVTDAFTTLTIKGANIDKLTINAPNASITVLCEVNEMEVTAVAFQSLHILRTVNQLSVSKGRVVLEQGATVTKVTVLSQGIDDKVVIVLENDAKITKVLDVKEMVSSLLVENKGTIQKVTADEEVPAGKSKVVNIDGGKVTDLENSDDGNSTGKVIISGDNAPTTVVEVSNIDELREALTHIGTNEKGWEKIDTIAFLNDISGNKISNDDEVILSIDRSVAIDGRGFTLSSPDATRGIWVDVSNVELTVMNLTIQGNKLERALQINPNKTNVVMNVYNVTATATYYTINICSDAGCNLSVEDSTLTGWGVLNAWSAGYYLNVKNSNLIGINDKTYDSEGWNDFGTVVLEGDTTKVTDMHSSNNTVIIENSVISGSQTKGNKQALILFNEGCENNEVQLIDCILVCGDEDHIFSYVDDGVGNTIIIDGQTVEHQLGAWANFD